jgi:uncharacterized protein YmfQ (DUF2313 family)
VSQGQEGRAQITERQREGIRGEYNRLVPEELIQSFHVNILNTLTHTRIYTHMHKHTRTHTHMRTHTHSHRECLLIALADTLHLGASNTVGVALTGRVTILL